jgi:hypothetical protein
MIASEIATPNKVILTPSSTPGFTHAENLSVESANLTSELLTINHDRYHTRWKATLHSKHSCQLKSASGRTDLLSKITLLITCSLFGL